MHKVLITTKMTGSSCCAIHTIVLDFDSIEKAKAAVRVINEARSIGYDQVALLLI